MMIWRMTMPGLLAAALATEPVFAQAVPAHDWSGDEAVLREQHLPVKGSALLQILRSRTPSPDMAGKFRHLVSRLDAASYAERIRSTADLLELGPVVRPLLETQLLATKADPETTARLRHVLARFSAEKDNSLVVAAARLIARDQPADSLAVLLDFIPHATNETVRQEVQHAINAVAFVEKKPLPQVMHALHDANPARQAAAAEALLRVMGLNVREDVAPLLRSSHPLVRYQIGMALIESHDKSGLPMLIQSLSDGSCDRVEHALELLHRAAGDTAPSVSYRGKSSVPAIRDAWMKWYEQHHGTLDLVKALEQTEMGYTLICCTGLKKNVTNKIFELDQNRRIRWEFDGPRYPIDAQILGPNRLLLAEYFDRRVSERDFKGNLLWQVAVAMPIACQRLPNGQTFIATRQNLMIVDRDGKEVFTCFQQNTSIITGVRLRNGQMVVVTGGGRCHLLDAQGAELKSFQMSPIYTLGGNVEVLPNGRILAPQYSQNAVVEFDWQGNKHWQAHIPRPISATRLSNGHTLVTCSLDYRVVELDSSGKEVWSYQTEGRPFRARRR